MALITILGICATFFTILILMVHGTYLGVKAYKTQQQKKQAKKANLNQLVTDILNGDQQALKRLQAQILSDSVNSKTPLKAL